MSFGQMESGFCDDQYRIDGIEKFYLTVSCMDF